MKLGLLRRSLVAALLLGSALPCSVAQTPIAQTPVAQTPGANPARQRQHPLRREKHKTDARALAASRVQDAGTEAQRDAALRPDFVPAQESLSEAAQRLAGDKIAMKAFEDRVSLHPSCETLQKAARLFAKSARYDKARAQEDILKDCGPQTLARTIRLEVFARASVASHLDGSLSRTLPGW